mmetsp:Transcript_18002/g.42062  ORF Transcript_18002/g.42062 Transcript_18002/m.42062 type:complete len:445 (+) Transcript_18002:69-1403(+)
MFRASVPLLSKRFDYVVVGGGNSAGYACREFVAQGVAPGRIAMMSREHVLPYERPALTKAYLHPPSAKVRARLPGFHTCVGGGGERQTSEWYEEKGIACLQGACTGVDFAAKTLQSTDGSIAYDKLFIATGASALRLSAFGVKGDDLGNVFYVREEKDAASLVSALERLAAGSKVVVIGGGYIGLECSAALKGWGFDTTMVFPEPSCMPRLFDADLASWLEKEFEARGIQILKGGDAGTVTEIRGANGTVSGVQLKSGDTLPADLVVVGVGAAPNTDFLGGALASQDGGIRVDGHMQTSEADVFAIGDICSFPSRYGGYSRCEHVDHARRSAAHAVQAALGKATSPYNYLPYFYSRIFEYTENPIVFNFFGAATGAPRTFAMEKNSIGAIWLDGGKIVGALMMGSPGPSADDAAKLRQLAEKQPAYPDSAATSPIDIFRAAGLA